MAGNTHRLPTEEQWHAVVQAVAGRRLAVVAGAGTGKTTTLVMIANALEGKRGRYIAFNKAIVADSARRLPTHVACSTAHSLAYQAVGRAFAHRLDGRRMRSADIAAYLNIEPILVPVEGDRKLLTAGYLAGLAMRAVSNFSRSAEREPSEAHVPYIDGIDRPTAQGRRGWANNRAIREWIMPVIRRVWADVSSPQGRLPFKPGFYLKVFELSQPRIQADFLLVDEAQDLSPVLLSIVRRQNDAQIVLVGDPHQAIYGWLGAVDAMGALRDCYRCYLSQSFRFGPAIAAAGNNILARLGAELRLKGYPEIASRVGPISNPRVILTRSNSGAARELLVNLAKGRSVALVGKSNELKAFCRAALELRATGHTAHPELACFKGWDEVLDYVVHDEQGDELKRQVDLIKDHGAENVLAALERSCPEYRADVVISTAHKSKGREWDEVRLARDFRAPTHDDECSPEELRLLYVACTRARYRLDISHVRHATCPPGEMRNQRRPDEWEQIWDCPDGPGVTLRPLRSGDPLLDVIAESLG